MTSTKRTTIYLLLRATVCAGLLSSMAISRAVWLPSFFSVPAIPIGTGLTAALVICFAAVFIFWTIRPYRVQTAALILLGILLCLGDISRLQAWFYFYLIAACLLTEERNTGEHISLGPLWCLLALLYFCGGVWKINHPYFDSAAPLVAFSGVARAIPYLKPVALFLVYASPFFEMASGILIFMKRTRAYGIALAICIHIGILIALGPLGMNVASVIWPWSIALVLMLLLAYRLESSDIVQEWSLQKPKYAALLLVAIIACGRFAGATPAPLAFALWSGDNPKAEIVFSQASYSYLQPHLFPLYAQEDGTFRFSLQEVSYNALTVDFFPTSGTFRSFFGRVCAFEEKPHTMFMVITYPDNHTTYTRCDSF